MFVVALVGVTIALFTAAATWDGPGGALKTWMTNG